MKINVLTVIKNSLPQQTEDLCGPHIVKILQHHFPDTLVECSVVSMDEGELFTALQRIETADYIITIGGTGVSPGDIVPDVTTRFCQRLLPGIAEMLRSESYKHSPYAVLSRGVAGIHGRTIIVNIPGSLKAALLCTRLLLPLIGHGSKLLRGEEHESYDPGVLGNNPA